MYNVDFLQNKIKKKKINLLLEKNFFEKMGIDIDRKNIKELNVDNNKIIFTNSDKVIAFTKKDKQIYN